jgi:hypothetical protein
MRTYAAPTTDRSSREGDRSSPRPPRFAESELPGHPGAGVEAPSQTLGDVTGPWECKNGGAHGLTALLVGVKKCADNIRGQSNKPLQRQPKGRYTKETQEVEEWSRWRWSP